MASVDFYAQEIPSNGIDDDGDCNIDCEDLDFGTRTLVLSNGMDASFVVGQNDFFTGTAGVAQDSLDGTYNIAVDPISKKVFIADTFNNRVLRYSSYNDFVYGSLPEIVLGQIDFVSKVDAVSVSGMDDPTGITVDNSGILWVADWNNNRVLRFENASTIGTNSAADGVLGQPDFTTKLAGTTAATMDRPVDLVVDDNGNLFVAEQRNGRVIRFDNAASKANGASADGVLGEANFTGDSPDTDAINLEFPCGIALVCNSLYVSDYNKHRILRWDDPETLSNGASADGVLGQSDFVSATSGLSQNTLNRPRILNSDSKNNLYVTDAVNERVLVYHEVNSKSNGANADVVIGQPDFTSNATGLDQNSFDEPRGVAVIENSVRSYLAVTDRANNRILLFGSPEYTTDEITALSGSLPGQDPSGSGGLNFTIVTDPAYGSVVIDNASTGAFTYTPSLNCSVNHDVYDVFTYEVSNSNGCSEIGELLMLVTDQGPCVEDCSNGVDDDENGLMDELDPECDLDGDGVINKNDIDNDNDGLTDPLEGNIPGAACSSYAVRNLFAENFGAGLRTSNQHINLCYENNSNVTCSPVYNAGYTSSVDPGEYTVVTHTDDANQGQYNWVSEDDVETFAGGRMAIFNPQNLGDILFEFRVDGVVPNVGISFRFAAINLWKTGSGVAIPSIGYRIMDTTGVVLLSNSATLAEAEYWQTYTVNYMHGNYSSLIIQLFNNQASSAGNDFALDNIELSQSLRDCDGDGLANIFDLDSDNDGIPDITEQNGIDIDHNGITDNIDGFGMLINDTNSNGADDFYEGQSIIDTDSDEVFDIIDLDADNDGLFDVLEAGGSDANFDGIIGFETFTDPNGNGISRIVDPGDSGTPLTNTDSDSDGVPNYKELDSDNDGCYDVIEAGFPDTDFNGFLGLGVYGAGLTVSSKGAVQP